MATETARFVATRTWKGNAVIPSHSSRDTAHGSATYSTIVHFRYTIESSGRIKNDLEFPCRRRLGESLVYYSLFPPALSYPAQVLYFFWTFLYFCFVPPSPPRCLPRGSLEQHFRQYSKLGQRGFCM